jgi:hypothetical protein
MRTRLDPTILTILRFVLSISTFLAGTRLVVRVAMTILTFWRSELADLLVLFI